jgi:hypothetical protein
LETEVGELEQEMMTIKTSEFFNPTAMSSFEDEPEQKPEKEEC